MVGGESGFLKPVNCLILSSSLILSAFMSSYTFKESSSSSSFETGSVAGVHIPAPVGQCLLLLYAESVLIKLRAFVRLGFSVSKGGAPRCRHEHVHTC